MLHIGHTAEAACRSRSISFAQPASAAGSEVPPVWFVLVKQGLRGRARQGREGGQRAALDRRQPRVGPEPGEVGERVRVVVGIDDGDHRRGVALGGDAVGGPDARPVVVGGLGRRGGSVEGRLGPGLVLAPVEIERSSDAGASRLARSRLGRRRAHPDDSSSGLSRPPALPRRPTAGGGIRRRPPRAAGRNVIIDMPFPSLSACDLGPSTEASTVRRSRREDDACGTNEVKVLDLDIRCRVPNAARPALDRYSTARGAVRDRGSPPSEPGQASRNCVTSSSWGSCSRTPMTGSPTATSGASASSTAWWPRPSRSTLLASALRSGDLSFDFIDDPAYSLFASFTDETFEELSARTGVPLHLLRGDARGHRLGRAGSGEPGSRGRDDDPSRHRVPAGPRVPGRSPWNATCG